MREKRRGREGTKGFQSSTTLHCTNNTQRVCVCVGSDSRMFPAWWQPHTRATAAQHSLRTLYIEGDQEEEELRLSRRTALSQRGKGCVNFLSFFALSVCETQQTKNQNNTHFPLLLCSFLFFFLPSFSSSSLPLLLPLPFSLPLLLPLLFLFSLKQGKWTLGGLAGWLVVVATKEKETGGRWIARK